MATDNTKKADYAIGGTDFLNSDVLKRALERIESMPEGAEKERQKFLLAQDYPGLKDILGVELADAEKMRDTPMPEGRQVGQVYVAANPLEHLSSALRQGIGAYRGKQSRDALRTLSADKGEALKNTMFPGQKQSSPQQQQGQVSLDSLTSQMPGLNQGLSDITQQAMQPAAQVGRAMNRRQNVREQGGTPLPVGQGVVGQAKQALSLRNIPDGMAGMGQPDLSQYGAPNVNAGMGQVTRRPRQEDRPFTLSGMKVPEAVSRDKAQDIGSMFGAGISPDQLTEEKMSLYELLKRNRR